LIERLSFLKHFPNNRRPAISQGTVRPGWLVSTLQLLYEILARPRTFPYAFSSKILKGVTQVLVALPSEEYNYRLPAPSGDWRRASSGLEVFTAGIA
jgi:hypothetical protein